MRDGIPILSKDFFIFFVLENFSWNHSFKDDLVLYSIKPFIDIISFNVSLSGIASLLLFSTVIRH